MISLYLKDQQGTVIKEQTHESECYLAFDNHLYHEGEKIVVATTEKYLQVQMDQSLAPSLIYLPTGEWTYTILVNEWEKRAFSPELFGGKQHYFSVKKVSNEQLGSYRNLALNPHAQKEFTGAYPHAFANVETRNDSTFFARNAIDGMIANESHGEFPYQSWGINQQSDAAWTVDFGREVLVDKLALVLRGDYPHDSYWTEVTVAFSDGSEMKLATTNQLDRQFFSFEKRLTTSVTLKNLIKAEDESPFPALTECEVYGYNQGE